MIMMIKSVLSMMIGFILSLIVGFILIPILKNKKANQSLSVYLEERHKKKVGTPTMGGLIFIIPTIIFLIFMFFAKKININYTLILVVFTFLSYSFIGFLDDYLIIKRNNNKGLSEKSKFILQIITAVIFMLAGNEPLIWIHALNIKINIGWLYGIFILLVLVASSNAVNITDGLDGLAGGLSLIAFITFSLISWNTGWLEGYSDIALFGFALAGSLLGFLVFNKPAKIFMGDTGSLALGATLGTYAILTRHELLLLIIGIVFVIETLSCVIQRFYYKLTKKRIFPMTPIHHTFEKMGWKEEDIVKVFWIIGLIGSMIALSVGVLL